MSYQQIQKEQPNVTEQSLLKQMRSFPITIKPSSSDQITFLPISKEQLLRNRMMSLEKSQSTESDSSFRVKSSSSLQHSESNKSTPSHLNQSPSLIASCLKVQSTSDNKTTRLLISPSISGSTRNVSSRTRKKNLKQNIKKKVYHIFSKYNVSRISKII